MYILCEGKYTEELHQTSFNSTCNGCEFTSLCGCSKHHVLGKYSFQIESKLTFVWLSKLSKGRRLVR